MKINPDQSVYVTFFDSNEVMPYQSFGPYRWADLEGLAIRAQPLLEDGRGGEVEYVATYCIPGTEWTEPDAPGEGWVADLGDKRFAYTDVSIGTADTRHPYQSPELTDDQIRRINHNDMAVRESVQEEL